MHKINQIIIASVFIFMLADIGFKVSILDALEKKQNSGAIASEAALQRTPSTLAVKKQAVVKAASLAEKRTIPVKSAKAPGKISKR